MQSSLFCIYVSHTSKILAIRKKKKDRRFYFAYISGSPSFEERQSQTQDRNLEVGTEAVGMKENCFQDFLPQLPQDALLSFRTISQGVELHMVSYLHQSLVRIMHHSLAYTLNLENSGVVTKSV